MGGRKGKELVNIWNLRAAEKKTVGKNRKDKVRWRRKSENFECHIR